MLVFQALFFWMFFLCATQDIAVDGWALTMLQVRPLCPNAAGHSLPAGLFPLESGDSRALTSACCRS